MEAPTAAHRIFGKGKSFSVVSSSGYWVAGAELGVGAGRGRELGGGLIRPSVGTETCRPRSCCPSTMWLLLLVLTSLATSTSWGEPSEMQIAGASLEIFLGDKVEEMRTGQRSDRPGSAVARAVRTLSLCPASPSDRRQRGR